MGWSINVDEFTSEGATLSKSDDGIAMFELRGKYSAYHIIRIPQLPQVELHAEGSDGTATPLAMAEVVTFTMTPTPGNPKRGTWHTRARVDIRDLPAGTRLVPVLTDTINSLRVPSTHSLAVS